MTAAKIVKNEMISGHPVTAWTKTTKSTWQDVHAHSLTRFQHYECFFSPLPAGRHSWCWRGPPIRWCVSPAWSPSSSACGPRSRRWAPSSPQEAEGHKQWKSEFSCLQEHRGADSLRWGAFMLGGCGGKRKRTEINKVKQQMKIKGIKFSLIDALN